MKVGRQDTASGRYIDSGDDVHSVQLQTQHLKIVVTDYEGHVRIQVDPDGRDWYTDLDVGEVAYSAGQMRIRVRGRQIRPTAEQIARLNAGRIWSPELKGDDE